MSAMPEAVLHPAVAAANQRIYVFGGEDAMQNPVRIIQVKSFDLCHCSDLLIMISFVFLRSCHVCPLQVYHIARNMWCKMENRMVKNVSAPAAIIDDKIYIIGGT